MEPTTVDEIILQIINEEPMTELNLLYAVYKQIIESNLEIPIDIPKNLQNLVDGGLLVKVEYTLPSIPSHCELPLS